MIHNLAYSTGQVALVRGLSEGEWKGTQYRYCFDKSGNRSLESTRFVDFRGREEVWKNTFFGYNFHKNRFRNATICWNVHWPPAWFTTYSTRGPAASWAFELMIVSEGAFWIAKAKTSASKCLIYLDFEIKLLMGCGVVSIRDIGNAKRHNVTNKWEINSDLTNPLAVWMRILLASFCDSSVIEAKIWHESLHSPSMITYNWFLHVVSFQDRITNTGLSFEVKLVVNPTMVEVDSRLYKDQSY